jgi:hypothetical protein
LVLIDNKNEFESLDSSQFFYLIHGSVQNLNHQFEMYSILIFINRFGLWVVGHYKKDFASKQTTPA